MMLVLPVSHTAHNCEMGVSTGKMCISSQGSTEFFCSMNPVANVTVGPPMATSFGPMFRSQTCTFFCCSCTSRMRVAVMVRRSAIIG